MITVKVTFILTYSRFENDISLIVFSISLLTLAALSMYRFELLFINAVRLLMSNVNLLSSFTLNL